MLELVLVACLLTDNKTCVEVRPPSAVELPTACLMEGQTFASRWAQDNPDWVIKEVRCQRWKPAEKKPGKVLPA